MCKYRVPKVDPVGFFVYSVVRRLAACTARCRADCVSVRFELRLAGCAAGSSFLARSRVNQKKTRTFCLSLPPLLSLVPQEREGERELELENFGIPRHSRARVLLPALGEFLVVV